MDLGGWARDRGQQRLDHLQLHRVVCVLLAVGDRLDDNIHQCELYAIDRGSRRPSAVEIVKFCTPTQVRL